MGTVHRLTTASERVTLAEAARAYLATFPAARDSEPGRRRSGTRRVYAGVLGALAARFGEDTALEELAPDAVAEWFTGQWGERSPARWNTARTAIKSATAYWAEQGWITHDPMVRLRRRKLEPDKDRALTREQIEELLTRDGIALRDRVLWRLLYETAGRATEILALDVEDLDLANRRARVTRKGGARDFVMWQSGSARLLPRLLKGRRTGPVFLTGRKVRSDLGLPPGDVDPASGRARLSYRQSADCFKEASGGKTLHQLRHSALSHAADNGDSVLILQARSGHESLRSLAKYAKVSAEALRRHLDETDPARRRQP